VRGAKRILIADDHSQTLQACRPALAAEGFEVVAAVTLAEASRSLADETPSLIVLDADLSGGNAVEFCARASEARGRRGIPVFLLVPPRLPESRLAALHPLCDECLFKPFHVGELVERIKRRLNKPARGYETGSDTGGDVAVRESAPAAEIGPGSAIAGCRIERILGKGGSGTVYLGRHLALDVRVALKLVSMPMAHNSAKDLERFIRGARAAIRIQHPNVVPLFNAGSEGGFHFLVQQYIEGETLKQRMAACGRLSQNAVLQAT